MTVKIRFQLQLVIFVIISFSTSNIHAQNFALNKYGLWVINDQEILNATIHADSNKQMIDIKKLMPYIMLDLRYATKNNFMQRKLYPSVTTTFLRRPAAKALQNVQRELNQQGMGLKIFDAYRPYSVTEKMWEPIKDDRYVADPKNGSGHNRGVAVDLTIIYLKTEVELNMGTGFDNFSDTAHQTFIALPEEILRNRNVLKTLMEKNGFKSLDTEWWHYSLPNAKDFELLDLPFKRLKKLNRD